MRSLFITFIICLSLACSGQSLTASLSACYNLNGHTQDAVNNLHGVVTFTNPSANPVPPTTDRFNVAKSARNLLGVSWSHIDFPDDPLIKPNNAITFSGWIRFSNFNVGINHILFTRNNQSTNIEAYQLAVQSNSVGFYFNASKAGPSGVNTATGTTQLVNLTWYHVAFTIDSNNIKLYLNGVLEGSAPVTFPGFDYAPGKKVILGGTNEPSNNVPIAAKVDNVRFYRRALTAAEINLLYTTDPLCNVPPQPPVCDNNTTYALTDGAIYYYKNLNTFSATSPTVVDVVLPDSATGLAVAPNFSFTAPNPTFWTIGKLHKLYYFDGSGFINTGHDAGLYTTELGGSKNLLYCYYRGVPTVYKYNGTGDATFVNNIYTFPNTSTTTDIVGDEADYFHLLSYGSPKAMGYYNPSGVPSFTSFSLFNMYSSVSGGGFAINDGTIITVYDNTVSVGPRSQIFNGAFNFSLTPTVLNVANDVASCYTKYSSSISITGNSLVSCAAPHVTISVKTNQYFPMYLWSGPSFYSITPGQAVVALPGVYTCTIVNGLNNSQTILTQTVGYTNASLTLNINPTNPTNCFPGTPAILTGSGAVNYTWSPNVALNFTNTPVVQASPSVNTTYTLIGGTAIPSCAATATVNVFVALTPSVVATTNQPTVCAFTNVTLTASGASSYTWNGVVISPTLTDLPGSTTIYTVVGTSTNGCTKTTTVVQYVVICTGLDKASENTIVKLFPNPTKDLLYIEANLPFSNLRYELSDIRGVLLEKRSLSQTKSIDLTELKSGVYFIRIVSDKSTFLEKVIKE